MYTRYNIPYCNEEGFAKVCAGILKAGIDEADKANLLLLLAVEYWWFRGGMPTIVLPRKEALAAYELGKGSVAPVEFPEVVQVAVQAGTLLDGYQASGILLCRETPRNLLLPVLGEGDYFQGAPMYRFLIKSSPKRQALVIPSEESYEDCLLKGQSSDLGKLLLLTSGLFTDRFLLHEGLPAGLTQKESRILRKSEKEVKYYGVVAA
jgi:hypothetical protein